MIVRGIMGAVLCVVLVLVAVGGTAAGEFEARRFSYWYETLCDNERELYGRIVSAAEGHRRRVIVSGAMCAYRALAVLEAVRYDNPGLFWLGRSLTLYFIVPEKILALDLNFIADPERICAMRAAFDDATGYIVTSAKELGTDVDRIRFVHNFLIDTNVWCENADFGQSAYSAAVTGETVCMGFSMAFLYFMQRLDIPAALVVGYLGEEKHAWNLVRVGGVYTNVDITINSRLLSLGGCRYTYFMVSDCELTVHRR